MALDDSLARGRIREMIRQQNERIEAGIDRLGSITRRPGRRGPWLRAVHKKAMHLLGDVLIGGCTTDKGTKHECRVIVYIELSLDQPSRLSVYAISARDHAIENFPLCLQLSQHLLQRVLQDSHAGTLCELTAALRQILAPIVDIDVLKVIDGEPGRRLSYYTPAGVVGLVMLPDGGRLVSTWIPESSLDTTVLDRRKLAFANYERTGRIASLVEIAPAKDADGGRAPRDSSSTTDFRGLVRPVTS